MPANLRYAGIKPNDTVDGVGITVSFWVQSCPHRCRGCHNPDTWTEDGGMLLPENYIEHIIELLTKNGIKRNLSILGGEPMYKNNLLIVNNLVKAVSEQLPDIKIFLWTGYTYEELLARTDASTHSILRNTDVLIDGKFDLAHRDITLWLKGSPNQRVIDIQQSRLHNKIILLNQDGSHEEYH